MTCEEVDARLFEYVEDVCEPGATAAIASHLDSCPTCQKRLKEAKALLGDLDVARSLQASPWTPESAEARPQLAVGAKIGEFEIIGELGRGGMGVVYRARQASLGREVALKVLNPALTQSDRSIQRFLSEAQAAARLHHTNIVPIYAQGADDGRFFYAMELIDGAALDAVLREESTAWRDRAHTAAPDAQTTRILTEVKTPPELDAREVAPGTDFRKSQAGTLLLSGIVRSDRRTRDYRRVARLVAGVAEALQHAHDQGVVHRDIKPQNLLLGADDQLHITDFGLARMSDVAGVTLSAEIVGTPAYMAPEQINHERGEIDGRTDIYALGATLYEMLAFERPFDADRYEQLIHAVLHREPRPPRQIDARIPADLETICLRALDKEPARRFPSAGAMARDLRRYADDLPIESRRISAIERATRWVKRNPALSSAIGAALLVVILGPLLALATRANANQRVEAVFDALMTDYHDGRAALGRLSWVDRIASHADRRQFVEAFAVTYDDPEDALRRLEPMMRAAPDNDDYRYLAAWAHTRRLSSDSAITARQLIAAADAEPDTASAAGYFLRGLAQVRIDPDGANDSFDRAISKRQDFMQAMLHQGRANNYLMYMRRDVSYYRAAAGSLTTAARLQPEKAYPRYLLSLSHQLYASSLLSRSDAVSEEDRALAIAAYHESEKSARAAQTCVPDNTADHAIEARYGFAAEAGYWESRGLYLDEEESFRRAIQAWRLFDQARWTDEVDQSERWAYEMRLHLRFGDFEAAEHARRRRFSSAGEPDAAFYAALIAMAGGDRDAARATVRGAIDSGANWQARALLCAIGRLADPALSAPPIADDEDLPMNWTRAWRAALYAFLAGELDEAGLLRAAESTPEGPIPFVRQRLRCVALFHAGMAALADGRTGDARTLLESAAETRDMEDYCFRARAVAWTLAALAESPDAQ